MKYPGALTDISVGGSQIWGVNSGLIYRKIGSGNWVNIGGRLKQVCARYNVVNQVKLEIMF